MKSTNSAYWKQSVRLAGLAFTLFLTLSSTPLPRGSTYAVVIGVSDYQWRTASTGDLMGADADARRIVQFLQTKKGGQVPSTNIRLLLNHSATRSAIRQAMQVFRLAKPGDRVLFYFSGHGIENGFAPTDIGQHLEGELSYEEVKSALRVSPAKTKICIADACFSGAMRQTTQKAVAAVNWTDKGEKDPSFSSVMILSSRGNQSSIESRVIKGGIFTYFFLNGLNGKADSNNDHIVTIRELYNFMAPRVEKSTPYRQRTVIYGHFSDDLPVSFW